MSKFVLQCRDIGNYIDQMYLIRVEDDHTDRKVHIWQHSRDAAMRFDLEEQVSAFCVGWGFDRTKYFAVEVDDRFVDYDRAMSIV